MSYQKYITVLLFAALLGLVSCASNTRLYERWNDKDYTGEKLNKVLVLGLFQDDIQRRAFEAAFVKRVDSTGKNAVAGYTLMPDTADFDSKEDILAAVKKINADAVLITRFKGVIEKDRHIAPRVDYVPAMGMGYGRYGYGYGGYYGSSYQAVYRPGYTTTDKIVQLDTRVFSVATEKLVWAGKTKSVNASSAQEIVDDLVSIVAEDMKKSGLID